MDSTAKLRALNDAFRERGEGNGRVYLTAGIYAFPLLEQRVEILRLVQNFTAFTPHNDPYGEHDFGTFQYSGKKIVWKIDYYDCELDKLGSPDPADESVTTRVLTISLAEEY
jgi:hypothetical protein